MWSSQSVRVLNGCTRAVYQSGGNHRKTRVVLIITPCFMINIRQMICLPKIQDVIIINHNPEKNSKYSPKSLPPNPKKAKLHYQACACYRACIFATVQSSYLNNSCHFLSEFDTSLLNRGCIFLFHICMADILKQPST